MIWIITISTVREHDHAIRATADYSRISRTGNIAISLSSRDLCRRKAPWLSTAATGVAVFDTKAIAVFGVTNAPTELVCHRLAGDGWAGKNVHSILIFEVTTFEVVFRDGRICGNL